jgi:hypothetical protein
LNARAEVTAHQDERCVGGGQHFVGVFDLTAIQLGQQGRPLRRRRRIFAGTVEAGDERHVFDLYKVHPIRMCHRANEPRGAEGFRIGFSQRGVGALRAKDWTHATGRKDLQRA